MTLVCEILLGMVGFAVRKASADIGCVATCYVLALACPAAFQIVVDPFACTEKRLYFVDAPEPGKLVYALYRGLWRLGLAALICARPSIDHSPGPRLPNKNRYLL